MLREILEPLQTRQLWIAEQSRTEVSLAPAHLGTPETPRTSCVPDVPPRTGNGIRCGWQAHLCHQLYAAWDLLSTWLAALTRPEQEDLVKHR